MRACVSIPGPSSSLLALASSKRCLTLRHGVGATAGAATFLLRAPNAEPWKETRLKNDMSFLRKVTRRSPTCQAAPEDEGGGDGGEKAAGDAAAGGCCLGVVGVVAGVCSLS